MRALIVDDEDRGRMVLRHMLEKYTDVQVVGEAGDGKTALQQVLELSPDVVFLDIRIPPPDGLEVARLLREQGVPAHIVFITAYGDYAVEAFELEAVDYLVKPIKPERVQEMVRRLKNRNRPVLDERVLTSLLYQLRPFYERKIPMEVAGENRTIYIEESRLRFAEAQGHKSRIVLAGGESYEVNLSLGELEKWLSPRLFLRVHRGFVVNLTAVQEVEVQGRQYFLKLKNCQGLVPLSRDRLEQFQQAMAKLQQV